MQDFDVMGLNVRLLATFRAVFEEGSVTRASVRLGASQSTVSHSLDRLRSVFDDPLFVRAGRNIVATERAVSLAPAIVGILEQVEELVEPEQFDPSTVTTRFVLSVNDYERSLLLPGLAGRMLKEAPHSGFKLIDTQGRVAETLRGRECDLVITPLSVAGTFDLYAQELFQDDYRCFFDAAHLSSEDVSSAYLELRHARVRYSEIDPTPIDELLAARGLQRDIAVEAPSFDALARIVRNSPLVVTLPARASVSVFSDFDFCAFPFPSPTLDFRLVWHRTTHSSARHRWFRTLIRDTFLDALGAR